MVVSLYRPWGQRTTFLQQNTYNFNSGWGGSHHCCGGSRGNGGLWAAFGITAGLSLLSNIFGGGNRGTQMTSQYGGYQPYGMMPGYSPMYPTTYLPQQTGAQQGTNQMANLEKLVKGKDYIILDEGNGQFTVSFGNGEAVTGDYATVRDAIFDKGNVVSSRAQSEADEAAQTAAASQAAQDGADSADATEETDTTTDTTTGTTSESGSSGATGRSGSSGRVRVPAGWERIATSNRNTESIGYNTNGTYFIDGKAEVMNRNDIENSKTAQDVANYLMYNEMNMPTPMAVDQKLVAEIIKYNPSVFNNYGTVKEKADWKKLDLPNRDYLESKGYLNSTKSTPPPSSSANGTTSQQETGKKDYNTTTQHHSDNFTAYVQYDNPVTASGGSGYVIVNGKKYSSITGFGLNAARNKNSIESSIRNQLRKAGYTGNITLQRVE